MQRTPLEIVSQVTIASPCSAEWDEMAGDDQVRYCDQCRRSVYDISQMTARAAVRLIEENEGHVCMRLYRRTDGTVLTADCQIAPVPFPWPLLVVLSTGAVAVLGLIVLLFSGYSLDELVGKRPGVSGPVQGGMILPGPPDKNCVMGDIAPPEKGPGERGRDPAPEREVK